MSLVEYLVILATKLSKRHFWHITPVRLGQYSYIAPFIDCSWMNSKKGDEEE